MTDHLPPSSPATSHPPWFHLFLGACPAWYKVTVICFLALNAAACLILRAAAPGTAGFIVGWAIVAEFIFCLALSLKCYPLLPGGLIALEALILGLTSPEHLYDEIARNLPVILLLVFIVAGVGLLKDWLTAAFTALLFSTRSKIALSMIFVLAGAFLSAFLDALTVMAVVITVCLAFWHTYAAYRSGAGAGAGNEDDIELAEFRGFLRNLAMHAAVGTALGGVMTVVGEPQNLLIAGTLRRIFGETRPDLAGRWDFMGFIARMALVTVPTLAAGLATTAVVERFGWFGYGARLPERVREVLLSRASESAAKRTPIDRLRLWFQGGCAALLVLALAFHLAEVGIIGLFLIVLASTLTGVSDEHRLGQKFTESLPFTALLVVFFAVVAVIADQRLFAPIIERVLSQNADNQLLGFYVSNAVLSAISDNVFVASIFINEAAAAHGREAITADQLERLAVAINIGTNLPSVATPNGQAAFLFLLTSALAAPIRLGYIQMLVLAFPYAVVLTGTSLACVWLWV